MEDLLEYWSQNPGNAALNVAAGIAGLILLFVAYRIVRRVVGFVARAVRAALAGVPAWIVWIAAILAVLAVRPVFEWLVDLLVGLVRLAAYDLPSAVFISLRVVFFECPQGGAPVRECLAAATEPLRLFWNTSFAGLLSRLWPPPESVWALAIFVGLVLLGLGARRIAPTVAARLKRRRRTPVSDGAILTLALLLALYLVITAIVATPVFEQQPSDLQATSERLTESLAGVQLALPAFEPEPRTIADNANLMQALRAKVEIVRSKYPGGAEYFALTGIVDNLEVESKRQGSEAAKLAQLPKDFPQRANEYRALLVSQFERDNRGRLGGRQTEEHADDIAAHYRAWLSETVAAARRCSSAIDSEAGQLGDRLNGAQKYLSLWEIESARAGDGRADEFLYAIAQALAPRGLDSTVVRTPLNNSAPIRTRTSPAPVSDTTSFSLARLCNIELTTNIPAPSRKRIEDSLSIFGLAAGWLLNTESRNLALITGMLGFGLFGALGASFIRGQAVTPEGLPRIPSKPALASVFVRGFSAAVLIYLVVVGGLAVFTKSEPLPNAYAVFFACFVAAVFSEDVWNWARNRQRTNLGDGNGAATKPKPPTPQGNGQESEPREEGRKPD